MREQQGVPVPVPLRAHRPDVQTQGTSRHRVGTSSGIHPEDRPHLTDERRPTNRQPVYDDEDDDALYETRLPNSTRRYAAPATQPPPRTVMRVTRHQGLPPTQYAHAPTTYEQPEQTPVHQRKGGIHLLVYVGVAMLCMLVGWIVLSSLAQWVQLQRDNWQYGVPRTFQIDADVRHGGMNHFTVENLQGHILIYEVQLTDMAKPHLYVGPTFSGAGTELQPATISFEDINGDGYPDMIITVGNGRYILMNDHSAFRPVNSSDHISGKGV
jgi:hypothetical protein